MDASPEMVKQRFAQTASLLATTADALAAQTVQAAEFIIASLQAEGAVFVFGNGGSAADAQHMAAELVGRFLVDRPAFRAEALTTDTSLLTSVANDYGYEQVFARQLSGKARPGDVAVGISTSGNSPNVVAALEVARQIGCKTVVLTGTGGGQCAALADVLLAVPSDHPPCVQETHAVIYHTICQLVEAAMINQP